jgi:hypothetical protein
VTLVGPFKPEFGHAFLIAAADAGLSDNAAAPEQSRAVLCEDGIPLSRGHDQHDAIRNLGRGLFSHWNDYLYFSTSDNSDPNTNDRTYALVIAGIGAAQNDASSLLPSGDRIGTQVGSETVRPPH